MKTIMTEESSTCVGSFFRTSCRVKRGRLQFQEEAESNVESNLSITKESSMWTHKFQSGVYTEEYVFKIDEPFGSFIFTKRKSEEK